MYNIQVSSDNQQILEEQLRFNKESVSDLWYKNAMNNQSGQLYNGIINHNIHSNYHSNQIINNQLQSLEIGSGIVNLPHSNNFRNSVQHINEDGAINCNRCSKTPIDYISLNCGHDFCLECMAISVIKGEGKIIQSQYQDSQNGFGSDENQNGSLVDIIIMYCFTCGKGSELGYQSTRAIDIFIQMVIQKYEQKQNILANQQTQNEEIQNPQQNNGIHTQHQQDNIGFGQQINTLGSVTQKDQRQSDKQQNNQQVDQNNVVQEYQQQNQYQQQQQFIQLQQKQNVQLQQQQQQIIPDNLQQYYDQNFTQYENPHLGSTRINEDNEENQEIYYNNKNMNSNKVNGNNGTNITKNSQNNTNSINNVNQNNINNINNTSNNLIITNNSKLNRNNFGMNGQDLKQNDELIEDVPTNINYQGMQSVQQNGMNAYPQEINEELLQQNQQYAQLNDQFGQLHNQSQNIQMNEYGQQNNITLNNGISDYQQNQLYQSNYDNQPTTPYMKTPQQVQQYEQKLQINNIRQSDKVRISQNEEDMNIQQVNSEYISTKPQNNDQNLIHEKQMFHQQQQQQQNELKNSTYQNGSQNNLMNNTPNYSILTEKKPTQPKYSQMIPTNNLTPQSSQNISKKNPHLSKSTHLMHNDGNHTPYQGITGKTIGYSPNTAQSQQFTQNSPEYQQIQNYHHPQQFIVNQPPLYSAITANKQIMLQGDESNEQNDQSDLRNIHPKLSAFSASKSKNPMQQKGQIIHLSHLQPYGNEDITSMFEAQLSHNQKHGIPYRQQSQLETGIIEQIEKNQTNYDNNIEYETGLTNLNDINKLQQQQKQFILQQQGRVQLQQVEETKESNSAVNSIIGSSTAQLNCNDHRFNELSLYCFTCDNKLLCIKCLQNGDHKDHDVQSIHKNFHYLLSKMKETSHQINARIELFTIHENRLQEKKKEYQKQIKIIKDQIQENLNEVKVSLVNKQQDLLKQAEQSYIIKKNKINQEIQKIQKQTQTINEVKNYFEIICENNLKKTNSIISEKEDDDQQQNQTNFHPDNGNNIQNRQQQQSSNQYQHQNYNQKQNTYTKPSTSENNSDIKQKNLTTQETNQTQNYEMVEHDFNEEFQDSKKSEIEKLNLFHFYSQCKSVLCSLGITINPQVNERLNSTLNQSITPQQFSSNHLSPYQTHNHINETPRNKNSQYQQLPNLTQTTQYYSQLGQNQGSVYQSNQQYLQGQQKQQQYQTKHQIDQSNYPIYSTNFEQNYASIRSNNSQPQEDEEQQNNEQYNLMSSQDLSQLIDDVQRIKKEANQIDLQNYIQKQYNQNHNYINDQRNYQNNNLPSHNIPSSIQPSQRKNQLFHEYLNQQNYLYNNQSQQMNKNYIQKEQLNEFELFQRQQQNYYSDQEQNIQIQDDQQKKNVQKNNEKPSTYSQYLLQRLSHNVTDDENKMSSSCTNQNSSHIIYSQPSDIDPLKKNISKNMDQLNCYINQKKSKWLDEETLGQDQEYFHNYHGYKYKNSSFYEKLNSTDRDKRDYSNYKQKQEFNKHLDNIFRNIGGSPNSFNKIQSLNSLDYTHNQKIGNFSNSVIQNMNGYQTERINTNPNIQNFMNSSTIQINKSSKGQKSNLNLNTTDYNQSSSSIPFSPNFKSNAIKSQNSFTTRAQNSGISRQSVSQHLKINPSSSIHNTTSNIQHQQNNNQQQTQSFIKFNNNYSKNMKSQTHFPKQNQINSNRQTVNNLDNLFETLRIQKEQFNQKKKNHFLIDK